MSAFTSWRKSRASEQSGSDCVEVAFDEQDAAVRDSKNAPGPILTIPAGTWRQFVTNVSGAAKA